MSVAIVTSVEPTAQIDQPQARPALTRTGVAKRMRFVAADKADVWDALARALPGGTAFHLWDFLDLQQQMLGLHIDRRVLTLDGVPVGIWPIARRSRWSPRAPWTPFPFLGPAVQPAHLPAALRLFRRHQWRTGLVLGRFDVAPQLAPAAEQALERSPMTWHLDGTVMVDLQHGSVEAMDAAMGRPRRKALRRAAEAGVVARSARPGETSRLLGLVLQQAYERHGVPSPYPADIGAHVERWAQGRDDVHLGVVEVEGSAAGAMVTLTGHPTAIAWVGASMAEVRESNAEAVLLRGGMVEALRAGCTSWDFGGRVDAGVEQFKRSFGGRSEPYLTAESFIGPDRLKAGGMRLRHRRPQSLTTA